MTIFEGNQTLLMLILVCRSCTSYIKRMLNFTCWIGFLVGDPKWRQLRVKCFLGICLRDTQSHGNKFGLMIHAVIWVAFFISGALTRLNYIVGENVNVLLLETVLDSINWFQASVDSYKVRISWQHLENHDHFVHSCQQRISSFCFATNCDVTVIIHTFCRCVFHSNTA